MSFERSWTHNLNTFSLHSWSTWRPSDPFSTSGSIDVCGNTHTYMGNTNTHIHFSARTTWACIIVFKLALMFSKALHLEMRSFLLSFPQCSTAQRIWVLKVNWQCLSMDNIAGFKICQLYKEPNEKNNNLHPKQHQFSKCICVLKTFCCSHLFI